MIRRPTDSVGSGGHRIPYVLGARHQRCAENYGRDLPSPSCFRYRKNDDAIPFWVKASCAIAIALGTYLGGWRIIRTLGKGIVEVDTPQGVAADGASAAIILTSSHFGMALSTTHVATGSILGTGWVVKAQKYAGVLPGVW